MLVILFILTVIVRKSVGLYENAPLITELDENNFDDIVTKDYMWLIQFYSADCGYSIKFKDKFIKLSEALVGIAKVGVVDSPNNPWLEARFEVDGYPTVKLFLDGPDSGLEYPGNLNAANIGRLIVEFIKETINDRLKLATINYDNYN